MNATKEAESVSPETVIRVLHESKHEGELKTSISYGTDSKKGNVHFYFDPSRPKPELEKELLVCDDLLRFLRNIMDAANAEVKS